MKKFFEEPIVEITVFAVEDVITASNPDPSNPDWSGDISGGISG